MGHCRVIYFLAFLLCFVACVFASGTTENNVEGEAPKVTLNEATQAVEEAKLSTERISGKAQSEVDKANGVLNGVNAFKTKVIEAESQATQVAADNEKAKAIVEKVKQISKDVNTMHVSVKEKLDSSIKSLEKVVSEAEQLKVQLNSVLPLTEPASRDYSDAKTKALGIKQQADNLDTNISEALVIINGVSATVEQIGKGAEDAKLKKLQVSGIVAGTELETTIGEADSITETITNKKEEVNDIVQKMKKRSTNAPTDLIESINRLLQRVDIELRRATGAFDKARKAKTDMTQQKETADAALTKVEKATEVNGAQAEVSKAEACVDEVKNIVTQLKIELTTAKNSVINANVSKQEMETALSKSTSKPSTGKGGETAKSDPEVGDDSNFHLKDATIQPTTINTDQPTNKELVSQGDDRAEEIKDKSIKGAQNVPTTALTGGKAPAPGAKNDSAMTVSVPLLVALIASAVLQ